MTKFFPEMTLFDEHGKQLYLSESECSRFLEASENEDRKNFVFCSVLHFTGCRISEALELTPQRISIQEQAIIFRTLKKSKYDKQGKKKKSQFRSVPVPARVIGYFNLVFDLRRQHQKNFSTPFWSMSRTTAWRMIKRVMGRAGVEGPQATPKGLRHAYGIKQVTGDNPLPLHILADVMGHSSTATTEIYTRVLGGEKKKMVLRAWDE